ncbi:MAG TPA: hypothetical protein VM344_06780 [Vitreimonas sp.]|nr:hypothetical protein [Vitreimonas sp.]
MFLLLIVASLVAVAAGCGGADGDTGATENAATYERQPTIMCLQEHGDVSTSSLDMIAEGAPGGGIRFARDGQEAMLAFGRTPEDAERIRASYETFYEGMDAPADDILFTRGNVAIAWTDTPTEEERALVENCLRG